MEIIELLKMGINEGKNYGKRFFKFFYFNKFYLIDNLKVDVLFRILKIQIQKRDLKENSMGYEMLQNEFMKAVSNKDILDEYSILTPELLDLVSQFETRVASSRKVKRKGNEQN